MTTEEADAPRLHLAVQRSALYGHPSLCDQVLYMQFPLRTPSA